MKNKFLFPLVALFLLPLTGCDKTKVVDLRPEYIKNYLSLSKESAIADYLRYYSTGNINYQNYKINLIDELDYFDGPFVTTFATNKDFSENVQSYKTYAALFEGQCSLTPGQKYFCKMENANGDIVYEDVFKTKDTPGVPIYAGQGVVNVRDMGGWKTKSGKRVKYGMIYRGGKLNLLNSDSECSEETKNIFENCLHIKTELDLRWNNDFGNQKGCAWGTGNYIKTNVYQYTFFIPNNPKIGNRVREYYAESVYHLQNMFAALADINNYPIYAHCNAGADRTGTFGYLVNGLLGVSYKDLTKDFELTSFSASGRRWRSSIDYDYTTDKASFSDSGVMQNDSNNYVAWDLMNKYMLRSYGDGKDNIQYAIEKFLTNEIGITKEQINTIKDILLS